jgi:flotillin
MDMFAALGGGVLLLAIAVAVFFVFALLRRVVPTNEVHIVQSSRKTVSYGKEHPEAGNTYYKWPSWVPKIGVTVVSLPVSVFALPLDGYEAYDQGRLPFMLDITAFFRIEKSDIAAQRVSNFNELKQQLLSILQGAVRTILASEEIERIMQDRSVFGEKFTTEVNAQLKEWGVTTVKSIELMDIRDAQGSKVIQNIMEKKKSFIEMQSRVEVAANRQKADIAEIEAKRNTELQNQEAVQQVGIRSAKAAEQVGIAKEQSSQAVKEQAKTTAEKEMEVKRVQEVKAAEIMKDVTLVHADQEKQRAIIDASAASETAVIAAEAKKKQTIISATASKEATVLEADAKKESTVKIAEGVLAATKNEAEGIQAVGLAKAESEKALQLAPVEAQIKLATEIGSNASYQQYLVTIRQVEANEKIGIAQADTLKAAHVKIIANAGSVDGGLKSVGELFSAKGGTQVGAMLEGLANTDAGKAVLRTIGVNAGE